MQEKSKTCNKYGNVMGSICSPGIGLSLGLLEGP